MEAIRSSETSVQSTTSTRRHNPEDGILLRDDMTDDGYGKMADFVLEVKKSRFFVQSSQSSNVEFASM
jgi:hypothetical protein